jgi:hypothetical protein
MMEDIKGKMREVTLRVESCGEQQEVKVWLMDEIEVKAAASRRNRQIVL